jgi:hypothetical protein
MMIAIRSFSGALNGNVAVCLHQTRRTLDLRLQVIKASLGDITDDSNSTEAFAMYGLTWTVGSIVGLVLSTLKDKG